MEPHSPQPGGPLQVSTVRWHLVGAALVGLALAPWPLVGRLGAESAVALGVVMPLLAASLGARMWQAGRGGRLRHRGPLELLEQVGLASLLAAVLPVVLLALAAMGKRACDPWTSLAFVVLGPVCGSLLAGLLGALMAAVTTRPRLGYALALAPPVAGLLLWGWEAYDTPGIFTFGHFLGYFPGPFYDRLVRIPDRFWILRGLSLAIGLGAVCLAGSHVDRRHLVWSARVRNSLRMSVAGAVLLAIGLTGTVRGAHLGLRADGDVIAETLGAQLRSERCHLFVPRELPHKQRLAAECDFRVAQAEAFFGVKQRSPVRVYLFRSAGEKRRLMGAAGTNIAKPWRNEIYIRQRPWPHPVLAHEVAHVVAGAVGSGPFRIAGRLGGLWPNPGLIEGMAVAFAYRPRGGLMPHEWARAMLELDRLPRLQTLLGAGFFGQQASLSYAVSGAFLRYLHDRDGAAQLRRAYALGDVAAATGQSLAALEQAFHAHLRSLPLDPAALELAKLRFSGRGLFSAVCPHKVARLEAELNQDLAAGDATAALATCREVLDTDPDRLQARFQLVMLLARTGDFEGAAQEVAQLERAGAGAAALARARHGLADELARARQRDAAGAMYQALLKAPQNRDSRRLVEVKALASNASPAESDLLLALLLGIEGRATDGATAVHLVRELAELRTDGLAAYLEARQLMARSRYGRAALLLARARSLGLPTESLRREALRIHAVCLVAAGADGEARPLLQALSETGVPSLVWEANQWLQRLDWRRTHRPSHP